MVPKCILLSACQSGIWAGCLQRHHGTLSPDGQKPKPAKDVSHPGERDSAVEQALNQESGHSFYHVSLRKWLPICLTLFPHLQK